MIISEPDVLNDASIRYLYNSTHAVTFDNNPKLLLHVRRVLGVSDDAILRPGFTLSSDAMAACKKEMDCYALLKASSLLPSAQIA